MNKELHEKIARLEAELEEMKKIIDGRSLKPEDGQEYWIISGEGVYGGEWDNEALDQEFYSIGNCFSTEQKAEDTVRALKLIQKARESQNGFVPDWENWAQNKHIVYCNRGVLCVRMYSHLNIAPIFGYWGDKSECDKFAKDNHDELIWFFTEYQR